MADMRKLIESMDSINEASFKTVANGEAFMKDIAKAFGGVKGQSLSITVTLKGTNVLEYSITKVSPGSPGNLTKKQEMDLRGEEDELEKARANRGYF